MYKPTILNHERFGSLRTRMINGTQWYVAKDFMKFCGFSEGYPFRDYIDTENLTKDRVKTVTGTPFTNFVSEEGVKQFLCRRNPKRRKEIETWLFEKEAENDKKSYNETNVPGNSPIKENKQSPVKYVKKNNILVFDNNELGSVRTICIDNEAMFCLADVCRVLEIGNSRQAKTRLNEKGVISNDVPTNGGVQKADFINEGNLYKLIFQSRKPQAEKFSDWVTEDVLPTIRKTGGYVSDEDLFIKTYLPFADDNTRMLFRTTLQTISKQNELIKKQEHEITHKEDVIIGLVEDIDLTEKRRRITQIIRNNHENYSDRYNLLYKEFSMKYHVDLKRRIQSREALAIKPKIKNIMDYIDRGMNMIPQLYEVACKLFENDVKKLSDEIWNVAS